MRSAALDADSVRPLSQFLVCLFSSSTLCLRRDLPVLHFAIDRRVAVWVKLYVLRSRKIRSSYPPNPVDTSFCAQVHSTTTLLREQPAEWLVLTTLPF